MDEQQQRALALETYDLLLQELKQTAIQVERHPKDPAFIPKSVGKDVMRIRVFPVERLPKGFWNSAACFYEIGVGPYEGHGMCLGGVQFFQYADQKRTGDGKYIQAVEKVLKALIAKAPTGYSNLLLSMASSISRRSTGQKIMDEEFCFRVKMPLRTWRGLSNIHWRSSPDCDSCLTGSLRRDEPTD